MGRGRAKAKQTKVARELKYFSPDTDLSALERELHGATNRYDRYVDDEADDLEDVDEAADDADEVDDDYGKWASGQR